MTDDDLTCGASPGLVFLVHRKSPGRQPRRPGQWLGRRPWERAVPVRFPPGRLSKSLKNLPIFEQRHKKHRYQPPKTSNNIFLWTDDNLTRGASPGLVFLVHRKFPKGSPTGQDYPNGWAHGPGSGRSRFDSPLARFV